MDERQKSIVKSQPLYIITVELSLEAEDSLDCFREFLGCHRASAEPHLDLQSAAAP